MNRVDCGPILYRAEIGRSGWIAGLREERIERRGRAQDRSTRKPLFPHARPAIDTVSLMLRVSAPSRVALC
jgi:hypothetical protein